MSKSLQAKLDQLEMLYSEQDHTIQALNDMIAQQDQEISQLHLNIEQIKVQLRALRTELSTNISIEVEQPPHY